MIYFELFYVFFLIGLFTFGGGYAMIPMIQEQIIAKGWLEADVLTDFIAISESTPGPFAINIATFVGSQTGGILGAVCSTLGIVLPSFIIILLVAILMKKIISNKFVKGALNSIKPVIIALILFTTCTLFLKLIFFGNQSFVLNNFKFNAKPFGLFIVLALYCLKYKKTHKKSLNAIALLGISALLGLIAYIV